MLIFHSFLYSLKIPPTHDDLLSFCTLQASFLTAIAIRWSEDRWIIFGFSRHFQEFTSNTSRCTTSDICTQNLWRNNFKIMCEAHFVWYCSLRTTYFWLFKLAYYLLYVLYVLAMNYNSLLIWQVEKCVFRFVLSLF